MIDSPVDLNACLNAHGLYNFFQCALRLSPEVHRKIAAMPEGIVTGKIDFDSIQRTRPTFMKRSTGGSTLDRPQVLC